MGFCGSKIKIKSFILVLVNKNNMFLFKTGTTTTTSTRSSSSTTSSTKITTSTQATCTLSCVNGGACILSNNIPQCSCPCFYSGILCQTCECLFLNKLAHSKLFMFYGLLFL